MDEHDVELARELLAAGLSHADVAKKFGLTLDAFAYRVLACDFKMARHMFDLRLRRGTIRLTEEDIERLCPRCEEFLPFVTDFWHAYSCKKDGAHGICRCCEHQRKAAMRQRKKLQSVTPASHL